MVSYIGKEVEILSPKDDVIFKSIFTRDDPKSKIVLMDLISSIIGKTVVDAVVINNEPAVMDIDEKQERLDVNCKLDDGELINLEMQSMIMKEPDRTNMPNLRNRMAYYAADLIVSQALKGKQYNELAKVYQVTFTGFNVFSDEDFLHEFKLTDKNNNTLTDKLNIILIELPKLESMMMKSVTELSSIEQWGMFLGYVDNASYRDTINAILQTKEEISMAADLIMSVSKDERERATFRSRRKFQTDLESNMLASFSNGVQEGMFKGIQQGMFKGIQEGMQKGKLEGKLDTARKMLAKKFEISMISDLTGLNEVEIRNLII